MAYYLDKSSQPLDYYLNLNEIEKLMYIHAMNWNIEQKVKFEEGKIKAMFGDGKK